MDGKELSLKQVVACGGKHPRDFILVDNYLLCANRYTDTVVSFAVLEDGTIGEKLDEVSIPSCVSLVEE